MNWTETRTEVVEFVCQTSTDGKTYTYNLTK